MTSRVTEVNWQYYRGMLPVGNRILTVFRFLEKTGAAKRYVVQHGWVSDPSLWVNFLYGELNESNRLSASQTYCVISLLNSQQN
jgi:hypothetical protein